jgi:transcription termination factor Rho
MSTEYEKMSLVELKAAAKEKGLKNVSTLRKQGLIDRLKEHESTAESAPQATQPSGPRVYGGPQNKTSNTSSSATQTRNNSYHSTSQGRTQSQHRTTSYHAGGYTQSGYNQGGYTQNGYTQGSYTQNTRPQTPLPQTPGGYQHPTKTIKEDYLPSEIEQLDSGETKDGILEVMPDGYGFIRCDNFLPGTNDVYVSPAQIKRFNLKTGDILVGNTRIRNQNEKFSALLYVKTINGYDPIEAQRRKRFEDMTPIFPNERIHLETPGCSIGMRMMNLVSPIGKGQRGMIVSPPKAGKTTLLKQVAKAITTNHPDMKLIILLIDERPEEVTDIKESIEGKNVEVIYSTFDELPENHKRVSEMVIERGRRLVEHREDVVILLDSITRLARAYNLTVQPSGRTLSGGLDPAALHMPKKFFGAARNMRGGGSLTILATALVETGSRMDDVVFEEFKGTGNMELVLDRSLSEKRIFPAIDLMKSSTRRDDLLLTREENEANALMHKALSGMRSEEALERIIDMFVKTKTNEEFIQTIRKVKILS